MTEYLSIQQVSARTGVSERTVHNWIQDGLKLLRVNKRVLRISTDDLDEFMPATKLPRSVQAAFIRRLEYRKASMAFSEIQYLPARHDPPGWVYFIQMNNADRFSKVGITTREVSRRIHAIKNANPYPITILGVLETKTPRAIESEIHHIFMPECVAGEWFELDADQIRFILDDYKFTPLEAK